jgi:site-specific recombinase XerD
MDLFGARVVGPLEPHAAGFAEELARLGYTRWSQRSWMSVVAHLSRWLQGEGLDVGGLTSTVARRYLVMRAEAGYRAFRSPSSLDPLLAYLRDAGVVQDEPAVALAPVDAVLERFRAYLLTERGLKPNVTAFYVASVRPFVVALAAGDVVDLARVSAQTVATFLVTLSRSLAPKTVQGRASALRALLRFWFLDGQTDVDLSKSVPKIAHRSPGLPKGLPSEQVGALLASCDIDSLGGLRDRAILTLLARLGLRAGEIARLQLDDVDWHHGEIVVRGKGSRRDRLPIPVDVGQVLVDYLRSGRPSDALDRCVFVRVKAPHRGLTATGVTQVVNAAAHRAGLGTIYSHRLRHTAATAMLAAGASLAEIGQVLRHRTALTTAIYAKVDSEALRALAMPWPQEVAR